MYFIQWGSLLTDNYNEQVDSFDLQIKHLDSKIDIEPLDEVIIYSEDENFSDTSEVINDVNGIPEYIAELLSEEKSNYIFR